MPAPFDQQAKNRFIAQIRAGRQPRLAAEGMQFAWSTVKKHLAQDRDFADAVNEATMILDEHVVETVYDLALEGNLAAAKMWLAERGRATGSGSWQDAKQVQVTGAGGGPIQVAAVSTGQLREALQSPDTRTVMLEMIRDIPAIEATATEVDRG